ncbi:hypothetical protein [Glycomyces buryatensis]|uniref:Uncharacterized protein n=1 Tax=Glycomyces buryatensis TaxID=2570927 RepID=A0A4S8PTD1_9ACTN|nr:hypothetical protein [Glycomyces buryatensis]THV34608.1 hypothetical protein FAB82_23980 [Glycomyces buryatensis]
MTPQDHPQIIRVRYATGYSITMTVVSSVLLIVGVVALLGGVLSFYLLTGTLLLIFGILSFSRPYYSYDPATGTLVMYALIGKFNKTYGSPKGEQVYFNGVQVMRSLPNGKQRKLPGFGVNKEDVGRLAQVLVAVQQQQQAQATQPQVTEPPAAQPPVAQPPVA